MEPLSDTQNEDYRELRAEADAIAPLLRETRHRLHRCPEKGTCEFKTDEIICSFLKAHDIPYEMIADTGILATVTGRKPGHANVVGLRADIDALPITEPEHADGSCCSLNPGMMHACGHDAHTTILLGTAALLKANADRWSGTVKCFFQPAEESVGGAERMVKAGCLRNPDVDYVAGLHVMPQFPVGDIEKRHGKLNASSDELHIDVYGRSGHGAYPEKGVDAIVIAASIITAMQSFVSRNISPLNSAVVSIGMISGGTGGNIICDHVELTGTLRTLDPETRAFAAERLRKLTADIAEGFGGTASLRIEPGYDALINSDELVDLLTDTFTPILGREHLHEKEYPSLGVEDFSFFHADHVKGIVFYHLGCTKPGTAAPGGLHDPQFLLDEDCLPLGAFLQYVLTQKLLQKD